jgi:hypothetical protein
VSVKTGIHRLAQLIKALGAILVILGLVGAVSAWKDGGVWLAAYGAIAGAVLWAIAWVLDGFAKE